MSNNSGRSDQTVKKWTTYNIAYLGFYGLIIVLGILGLAAPWIGLEEIQPLLMSGPVGSAIGNAIVQIEEKVQEWK